MNWSATECLEWLPFVQAVAEGKSILMWTGYMEKVEDGVEYASRKDDEWNDIGNNLPLMFSNNCVIHHPIVYLKIKED